MSRETGMLTFTEAHIDHSLNQNSQTAMSPRGGCATIRDVLTYG